MLRASLSELAALLVTICAVGISCARTTPESAPPPQAKLLIQAAGSEQAQTTTFAADDGRLLLDWRVVDGDERDSLNITVQQINAQGRARSHRQAAVSPSAEGMGRLEVPVTAGNYRVDVVATRPWEITVYQAP